MIEFILEKILAEKDGLVIEHISEHAEIKYYCCETLKYSTGSAWLCIPLTDKEAESFDRECLKTKTGCMLVINFGEKEMVRWLEKQEIPEEWYEKTVRNKR